MEVKEMRINMELENILNMDVNKDPHDISQPEAKGSVENEVNGRRRTKKQEQESDGELWAKPVETYGPEGRRTWTTPKVDFRHVVRRKRN